MILFDNNIMIQINIMTDSTKVQSFYENNWLAWVLLWVMSQAKKIITILLIFQQK